ncbi:MAG: tRNA pseudouridine(55) synthase TruB [Acidimicrobiales bacterium]|nr:tRNA pseudouridine(55) synthase TruB [Acidimicrobiales bacterium]
MPDGLAVVDKPAGWTSHDVVAKARGLLRERRVGHAGTLDPDATGVLLLGVGRVTRLLRFLSGLPKSYEGEVVLGTATSTLDASGEVTARADMAGVAEADVRAAAAGLTGELLQVPPMVSAVKVGGRRLHELARQGVEVERAPRPVTVTRFDVAPTADPLVYAISVECGSGTYVRVLAADLGAALGGAAHLRALRRTAVGPFGLAEAVPLGALDAALLLPPAEALRGRPRVVVGAEVAAEVAHGKVLERDDLGVSGTGPWAVVDAAGALLAVYEPHGGRVKPAVVVAVPPSGGGSVPG